MVTCVELGGALVEVAEARFASAANVHIVHADFEAWQPADATRFDAAIAATAWHWIDPSVGYPKLAALLRPGGHLAVWTASHVFPSGGDDFFVELEEVERVKSDWPHSCSRVWPHRPDVVVVGGCG